MYPLGMELASEISAAAERIRPHVRETPVEEAPALGRAAGCRVFLKLENIQHTGSFKFRGAMNKLLSLDPDQLQRGVVAASTGNHGAAVAQGARDLGTRAVIFAPETADAGKLAAMRQRGADVRCQGDDCVVAEALAREFAGSQGLTYISPYNDREVVAGQGTIGVELERQLGQFDAVITSVGGGGLISGVGAYLKSVMPELLVIGASPRNSAVMHASLEAGRLVHRESLPTLSDGTAGGVEEGSLTFELCQDLIDEFVLVDEEDIATGVRSVLEQHHLLVEGAAGVAVAALTAAAPRLEGLKVAVVLCGANIDAQVLAGLL